MNDRWENFHGYIAIGHIKAILRENSELRQKVAQLEGVVEDVCVGTKLQCALCGNYRPCLCQDCS
jgi:hypothetical protein